MPDSNTDPRPWLDRSRPADERAALLVAAMTLEERVGLLHSHLAMGDARQRFPEALGSAAYTPGIERLGMPPIQESDAGLGVANPGGVRPDDVVTALPSALALGASFDPELAGRAGAVIGAECRAKGFVVLLAGGANLVREPRGGRVFEYVSEDPLLTGRIAGATVAGVQSAQVVSTVKHFAVNPQEIGRMVMSAELAEPALRESDLLAFQLAIEDGQPGAVMTAYNAVNGEPASQQRLLLRALKDDWGYPGFVMSDWGGTHSTEAAALAGLDRQSGQELDPEVFFGPPLLDAVRTGRVPADRVEDMARRLCRSLIEAGWLDDPPQAGGEFDVGAHARVAQDVAEAGIVLLANDGTLPLASDVARIAVIGGFADVGVLSGGGSSQVLPAGSVEAEGSSIGPFRVPRVRHPSPPLAALRAALPHTDVAYADGSDVAAAAELAAGADVAVVLVEQWRTEGVDAPDLRLPDRQDQLVAAVAARAPRTVVVLVTGGPVTLPWRDDVAAVLAAWYPGGRGGEALAALFTGAVNPSGRLPVTFPRDVGQLPRRELPDPRTTTSNPGEPRRGPFSVEYDVEGADVGYRWYARTGAAPAYPFGFGRSYTTFSYGDLAVTTDGAAASVALDVTNTGGRAGVDVPQVYVELPDGSPPRLAGWARVALDAGETRRVGVALEPRILAGYDADLPGWRTAPGRYRISVRTDAATPVLEQDVELPAAEHQP